jgi:hypothetical protein
VVPPFHPATGDIVEIAWKLKRSSDTNDTNIYKSFEQKKDIPPMAIAHHPKTENVQEAQ